MIAVDEILEAVTQYSDILNSKAMFLAYMKDLFPEEELSVRLLYDALCLGIVEEIKNADVVDSITQNRFIKILCNKYGISEENAHWCIGTWTKILGKNMPNEAIENYDEEEINEDYTRYPYEIVFYEDVESVINDFQFDTMIEPDNLPLKYHYVSYLSTLVKRPQDNEEKEMYVLELMEKAIEQINVDNDDTFEDTIRKDSLLFTKGYTMFLKGRIDVAFECFCLVCKKIKSETVENKYAYVLDELYRACVFNIFSIMKICGIDSETFNVKFYDLVNECLQDVSDCRSDDDSQYFYIMSSTENDFYNVTIKVGDELLYKLPDLYIGYLKLLRKNNMLEISWNVYGNKLNYSIELTSEILESVKQIANEYGTDI